MDSNVVSPDQHVWIRSLRCWGTTLRLRRALAEDVPAAWDVKLDEPISNIERITTTADDLFLEGPAHA